MIWAIAALVLMFALVVVAILLYNRLVELRNRAENAWAQVDVQLQRRQDLILNLVQAVKGYAAHERDTLEQVTSARVAAQRAATVHEHALAENVFTAAIGRLFAVAESYPELRASESFRELQTDLERSEDKIAVSRQLYNDAVLSYDTATESVPTNVVAAMFRFEAKPYFEIEDHSRPAPPVGFASGVGDPA